MFQNSLGCEFVDLDWDLLGARCEISMARFMEENDLMTLGIMLSWILLRKVMQDFVFSSLIEVQIETLPIT